MRILSIDPGGTVGTCEADISKRRLLLRETLGIPKMEFNDYINHRLDGKLGFPEIVIYESFRLFPNKATAKIGSRFEEAEQIGVILYLCHKNKITVVEQMPLVKKFFMPINRLEFYCPVPKIEHSRDALRHILYYLVFKTKELGVPDK